MVILGAEAQSVAVAWQVYALTHSALALGYTGLALFLPGLFVMLAAGHAADRYDRRKIILLCYGLQAICTAVLLWLSMSATALKGGRIWPIYAVLVGIGLGRAFSGPAASAMLPSLVPKEHFVNAVTWCDGVSDREYVVLQSENSVYASTGGHGTGVEWRAGGVWIHLLMLMGFIVLVSMIRAKMVRRKGFQHEDDAGGARICVAGEACWFDLARSVCSAAGGATALLLSCDGHSARGPRAGAAARNAFGGSACRSLTMVVRPIGDAQVRRCWFASEFSGLRLWCLACRRASG
jgi:MFS family permease